MFLFRLPKHFKLFSLKVVEIARHQRESKPPKELAPVKVLVEVRPQIKSFASSAEHLPLVFYLGVLLNQSQVHRIAVSWVVWIHKSVDEEELIVRLGFAIGNEDFFPTLYVFYCLHHEHLAGVVESLSD